MDAFCYLCFMFVFVMLSCPFLTALLVTCWEGADLLALLCLMFSCVFVTSPYGVSGQVWYLIVLIPDICLLPYLYPDLCLLPYLYIEINKRKYFYLKPQDLQP